MSGNDAESGLITKLEAEATPAQIQNLDKSTGEMRCSRTGRDRPILTKTETKSRERSVLVLLEQSGDTSGR
jgi:hypothetical protein